MMKKLTVPVLFLMLAMLTLMPGRIYADSNHDFGMMGDMGNWGNSWMMGWGGMAVLGVLFWGIAIASVIGLSVVIVRAFARKENPKDDPKSILKQRLAKGEITVKEYEESKKNIEK